MFYLYGAKSAGVFTLSGVHDRFSHPRALAMGSVRRSRDRAVLLLSGELFEMSILLFPAWVALISILILVQVPERASRQA